MWLIVRHPLGFAPRPHHIDLDSGLSRGQATSKVNVASVYDALLEHGTHEVKACVGSSGSCQIHDHHHVHRLTSCSTRHEGTIAVSIERAEHGFTFRQQDVRLGARFAFHYDVDI